MVDAAEALSDKKEGGNKVTKDKKPSPPAPAPAPAPASAPKTDRVYNGGFKESANTVRDSRLPPPPPPRKK